MAFGWGPFVLAFDQQRNPGWPVPLRVVVPKANDVSATGPAQILEDSDPLRFNLLLAELNQPQARPAQLVTFADAGSEGGRYAVWLRSAGTGLAETDSLFAYADERRSASGNVDGSITDGDFGTFVVTFNGQPQSEAWFAVQRDQPVEFKRVVFAHGRTFHDGGWFDASNEKPRLEIRRQPDGPWEEIAELSTYPATSNTNSAGLIDGQSFTVQLPEPVRAVALRIIGRPASGDNRDQAFASCAELQAFPAGPAVAGESTYDVVIYGGTAGGVMAAVQVARMGSSVVLIEPSQRLGGLTTGGLGQTDIGNKRVIGGLAREFYRGIRAHYEDPAAWTWQSREDYRDSGQTRTDPDEDAMWTFEPSAALKVLHGFVQEAGIPVVYGERLDLERGVDKMENRIEQIRMESGRTFRGRMFIDATYEGDLLAKAGVTYTVGREANARYGETLNGVQTANAHFHQLLPGVDPYVRAGDPASGLLPGIDPTGPGEEGAGDHRVQAYCFRMCLTDHPENRIPFNQPDGYNELDYELLLRNFEAGERGMPWINSAMPNRKTDTNNRTGFSTDFIGQNYAYPEADYATRDEIVRRHRHYQQGLMWTLANHSRIPDPIRREFSRWGMTRDEFIQGNGWQEQLYIREARRMIGSLVMTQHHCQGREVVADPVGMAAYTMDSHHVQRYVDANGHARNEGDVQVGGFPPYPISYRAITPKESDCANLLVPVCLSASHIAFGSIRMEPVFMVLGQSAATAAIHALKEEVAVQQIDFDRLEARLRSDGQVLD
jgi:hypothetical protein